jgi:hypothetical protein
MHTYARVLNGIVMELFSTAAPIATLFPPTIVWVDVTSTPDVQVGWVQVPGGGFGAPAGQTPVIPPVTLASVQAQLTALQAQVNQLAAAGSS